MKTKFDTPLLLVVGLAGAHLAPAQGPLSPPGAPAPTMKTLEHIEPRTLIADRTSNRL